jgi:hypothetical protein
MGERFASEKSLLIFQLILKMLASKYFEATKLADKKNICKKLRKK